MAVGFPAIGPEFAFRADFRLQAALRRMHGFGASTPLAAGFAEQLGILIGRDPAARRVLGFASGAKPGSVASPQG